MKSPDRILRETESRASKFVREIIGLAEEQNWTFRVKGDGGLLFLPPDDVRRPGYDTVFLVDPHNDSHIQKVVRDRFKKAGMKFPEDQPKERKTPMSQTSISKPLTSLTTPTEKNDDPFALIETKLCMAADLLAESVVLLGKAKENNSKLDNLRKLLKDI